MQGHLAAVAVGSARTELSANNRLMGRFFEQGVPADDDTCVRMMRASPSCGEYGQIDLDISDVFKLELVALPAGAARVLDEDRSSLRRNTSEASGAAPTGCRQEARSAQAMSSDSVRQRRSSRGSMCTTCGASAAS